MYSQYALSLQTWPIHIERRVHSLRTATLGLTDKIFWFSPFELVARDGFWSPVRLRAKGEERLCLR
jgi:hypothetical protein